MASGPTISWQIDRETMETVRDYFLGLQSHCRWWVKLKDVCSLVTNLDNVLKRRDITLPTKVCLFKAMVFPVFTYGCESWTIKKAVQFSCSVVSDSLRPHGLQHARPPCPSPTPRVYSNSCPLSQWCHPSISSSVIPVSFCLQSFPESGSFPMSQFFASDGQGIGTLASNEYSGLISFRIDWLDLLAVQGTLESSPAPQGTIKRY